MQEFIYIYIYKHAFGKQTTLIISNDELNDILKIVQALKEFNILLKRASQNHLKIKQQQQQKQEG